MRANAIPFKYETGNKLKIKKIAAGKKSFGVVSGTVLIFNGYYMSYFVDKNELLSQFGFAPAKSFDTEMALDIADAHTFGSGEVLDIGGSYNTRFAIVKN